MEARSKRLLAYLMQDASWTEALTDARVLRRRLILAEILARPLAERGEPRDLTAGVTGGRQRPDHQGR